MLASLPWLAHASLYPKNDACMYLLTARSILAGEGYSLLGQPFSLRPPGFSLLLAPLLSLFGSDFGALNLVVNLLGVLAVSLVYVLARPRLGTWCAAALALLLWTNPGFRRASNQIMSDVPAIAFALSVLVLERRWRPSARIHHGVVLGLLAGCATLVRTANVLLLPAVLAGMHAQMRKGIQLGASRTTSRTTLRASRTATSFVLAFAAVLAPWVLRNAGLDRSQRTQQTSVHSYGTAMFHVDPSDPNSDKLPFAAVAGRVPGQLGELAETLGTRFTDAGGPFTSPPSPWSILGILGLLGALFIARRRREPLEIMALGAAGLVAVYFAFVDRLALPAFVFGAPAVAEVLVLLLARVWRGRGPLLVAIAWVGLAAWDARRIEGESARAIRQAQMLELASEVNERVPQAEPVATRLGWELGVYLEGRTVHSLYMSALRSGQRGALRFLRDRGLDYALFDMRHPDDRTLRNALARQFRVSAEVGDWVLLERK